MLYFDDITTDYRSEVGSWQLTPEEIIEVARRWDPQPFHIDEAAAQQSAFGELVASSLHIFAICTRLFFDHEDHIQVMAMLSKDRVQLPNPAKANDLLTYRTACIDRKASSSKPDRGVITLSDEVTNQHGATVLTQQVTLLVAREASRAKPDVS